MHTSKNQQGWIKISFKITTMYISAKEIKNTRHETQHCYFPSHK